MRLSLFAYRLLLLAVPAPLRREFGDDMTRMFAMQMATALLACAIPARKAMRVDPVTALRGNA